MGEGAGSPVVTAGTLAVWVAETVFATLRADTGDHPLLRGTESVPLGFHDSVQKRPPALVHSDPLVQAIALKMALPTLIIWHSTLPGANTFTVNGTAPPFRQLLH